MTDQDANDLRTSALEAIENARSALHSWQFIRSLKQADSVTQGRAATLMLNVAFARQNLAAAILGDIVKKLQTNEQDLEDAINGLKQSLLNLDEVSTVLDGITDLLTVIGKIVAVV